MISYKYLSMSLSVLTALSIRSMEQKQQLSGSNSTTETFRPSYLEVATGVKSQPASVESSISVEVVEPVEHVVQIGETITLELPKVDIVSQETRQDCELKSKSPRNSREASPVRPTTLDRDSSPGREAVAELSTKLGRPLSDVSSQLVKNQEGVIPTKKISANPHYQKPSWVISRLWGYLTSPTELALHQCATLKEKPVNSTAVIHVIEWGINETIGKACTERDLKDRNSIDGLQSILRANHIHTLNLRKMVETCKSLDMQLGEEVLTNVYKHLAKEDEQDLTYARLSMIEAKKRLQERKRDRRDVYAIKYTSKADLGYISGDEYSNESMAQHFLTYEQNNK